LIEVEAETEDVGSFAVRHASVTAEIGFNRVVVQALGKAVKASGRPANEVVLHHEVGRLRYIVFQSLVGEEATQSAEWYVVAQ
jgi:hypothetical protein